MLDEAQNLLQQYFGYSAFRDGQREIIENIGNRKNTLGILPTGGGKSLCYQIPALLFPRNNNCDFPAHITHEGSG